MPRLLKTRIAESGNATAKIEVIIITSDNATATAFTEIAIASP